MKASQLGSIFNGFMTKDEFSSFISIDCPRCGHVFSSKHDSRGLMTCPACHVVFAGVDSSYGQINEEISPTVQAPNKKDVALGFLGQGRLMLMIDARHSGVRVPAWLKTDANLKLRVGYNMAVPIPDLSVDDSGVSCTLSFQRAPFYCVLPWEAIYAMIDEKERGIIWPLDVPSVVQLNIEAAPLPKPPPLLQVISTENSTEKTSAHGNDHGGKKKPGKKKKASIVSEPDQDSGPGSSDAKEPQLKPVKKRTASPSKKHLPKEDLTSADLNSEVADKKNKGYISEGDEAQKGEGTPAQKTQKIQKKEEKIKKEIPSYLRIVK